MMGEMMGMRPVLQQITTNLRLNLRSPMAMIYGFAFPLIFLAAFRALYNYERIPLLLHMGQLLTVTVLGGACFGLPTTLVSERERGVWRRYRLSPSPAWVFVAGILLTRYLLLLTAALLQIALAIAIGMTVPAHPLDLAVAFSVTAVAFLGLGMVIAMLAESVPAVQALGQCIFLPMLMIGGVAVRLTSLPPWALHVSAFLPGRYAVDAIQAAFTAGAPGGVAFDLTVLGLTGAAGFASAACAFRWNPRERSAADANRSWLLVAPAMLAVVGMMAESQGRIAPPALAADSISSPQDFLKTAARPASAPLVSAKSPDISAQPPAAARQEVPAREASVHPASAQHKVPGPSSWQEVSEQDFDAIAYDRLPSDEGIISPVAHSGETSDPAVEQQLEQIRTALATWAPGRTQDLVQRARNDLYVAAVPDVLEMEQLERFVPLLVFSRLQSDIPGKDLPKILYWIATHPAEGDDSAVRELKTFGLPALDGPAGEVRHRVVFYALKLLGRITGQIS